MQTWIHPDKRRYYQAWLSQDLFGDWTLIRRYGGLQSKRGNHRIHGFPTLRAGQQALQALDHHRRLRGYRPIEGLAQWRDYVPEEDEVPEVDQRQVPQGDLVSAMGYVD